MTQIVAVPVDWTIYEVDDDLIVYLNSAVQVLPPYMVLESLVLAGKAKRMTTETMKDEQTLPDGPWFAPGETTEGEDDDGDA